MLDLMGGLFFVDALRERDLTSRELILPFVPGSRQDRLNDAGDFLFTAKSVAREINVRNFRSVTIFDPHSEVTPALIDRCHVMHAHECFDFVTASPIRYTAIISPDAGAEKRAGMMARKLGLPVLHGWKTRDVATGNITGFGLEPYTLAGPVLVVDDICDAGGTFIGLAQILKERGLEADLFVTHGLFTKGTEKLLEHYRHIFCTDSVVTDRPGIIVNNLATRLIEEFTC
jgi:ribose-phosphate pyrophosphokinase